VRDIEITTRVPKKFRFPFFTKYVLLALTDLFINGLIFIGRLSWYVGEKCLRDLRAKEDFSMRVLESIEMVACFLVSQAREIERGSDSAKREAKEAVPSDRVKDASAVARELRWRVRLALGWGSDGETADGDGEHVDRKEGADGPVHRGGKRRRGPERDETVADVDLAEGSMPLQQRFRHFQPKAWESVERTSEQRSEQRFTARPGDSDNILKAGWTDGVPAGSNSSGSQDAVTITSRQVVTTKVRKTETGLERQRVESVLERWDWVTA
jgi:hypothetical protein